MLEIKITVTKMKNAFDRRISRLDTAKERIDESQRHCHPCTIELEGIHTVKCLNLSTIDIWGWIILVGAKGSPVSYRILATSLTSNH